MERRSGRFQRLDSIVAGGRAGPAGLRRCTAGTCVRTRAADALAGSPMPDRDRRQCLSPRRRCSPLDGFGFLSPSSSDPPARYAVLEHDVRASRRERHGRLHVIPRRPTQPYRRLPLKTNCWKRFTMNSCISSARWAAVDDRGHPLATGDSAVHFGHRERIGELERAEQEQPGLFFCANYRGGVSISDCISRGTETAQWVAAHLGPSGRVR